MTASYQAVSPKLTLTSGATALGSILAFLNMRIDLFLKASRLCPRRTVAQNICEAGRVSINGSAVKSSHLVKPGDEILLRSRTKVTRVRVASVPTARQISRKEAGGLYEVLSEESLDADGSIQ